MLETNVASFLKDKNNASLKKTCQWLDRTTTINRSDLYGLDWFFVEQFGPRSNIENQKAYGLI